MNSAPESYSGLDSSSPLELMLDRAMDRCWATERDLQAQRGAERRRPATAALVVSAGETALATLPGRLHWRGIEVSEEFQRYAARVARGEQLAPYRGQVLARHCPDFPWGAAPLVRAQRAAEPLVGRSTKIGAVVLSAGTALLAAIGVGSGAGSPVADEVDVRVPEQGTSALRPAPYVDPDQPLASVDVAEHVTAAGDTRAKARTQATRARRTRSAALRRSDATAAAALVARSAAANASLASIETPGVSAAGGDAALMTATSEDPFGLNELALASKVHDTTNESVDATRAPRPSRPAPTSTGSHQNSKMESRVGKPSDWDPTGKMSVLFSDDLPF
jgi:hypothetical protein